jgi:phosphatidate cytidylyltransferase
MAFPDPPARSGEGSQSRRSGRHRARHRGAAPDPYPAPHEGTEPYPAPGEGSAPYPGVRDDADPYLGLREDPRADRYPGLRDDTDQYSAIREGTDTYAGSGAYPVPRGGADPYPGPRVGDGWREGNLPATALDAPDTAPVFVRPGPDGERPDAGTGAPTVPKASRAGRNLPAAIGVGVLLAAVVLVTLFYWRPAFLGVVVAAVSVGMWEMARAVRSAGARPPLAPLFAGGAVMVGLAWFGGPEALSLGLLLTVLATMVWRLADGAGGYQRDVTAATLIAMYVPFLGGFAALLAVPDDGHLRIIVTLAAVVLSDTGGYAAGVFFGRHPMAPAVSPKKSWEGFAGSLAASAGGGALLLYFLFDVVPWWGALYGLALATLAVLGDLTESMLKRDLGIKDMSQLLPGHGGLMDRLDSILFALPASYLLLSLLVTAPK